ncbi:MAG: hypothetical protein E6I62_04260 [Chloroflexi bacterium]|nr:MAG: hypothetical protein E6I62_04260 [Chloroflexota bacterium]
MQATSTLPLRAPPALDRIQALLARLDPEQRAAATLPDGPAQIIAPAGSGKTTTLIARLGHLLARGVGPERIAVMTFNRDATERPGGRARAAAARGPPAVHGRAIAGCSAAPGRWHARYPPLSVEGRGASSSGGRAVGADRLPVPPRGSPCARLRRSGRGRRRPARLGPSTPHALAGPLQSRLRG